MTPAAQASTRKPGVGQGRVLWALLKLRAGDVTAFVDTTSVHELVDKTLQASRGVNAGSQRGTFEHLTACYRNGWCAQPKVLRPAGASKHGEHLAWQLTRAGEEALARALEAAAAEPATKEDAVEAVPETETAPEWAQESHLRAVQDESTPDYPETDAAPEEAAEAEPTQEEVDTTDAEVEIEEEPVVVENQVVGNQLTMKVVDGRLKPTQSTLKVNAKQTDFGTTREFKIGDRIPFEGVLEVREVTIVQKSNGRIVRIQKAVIAESNLLTDVEDAE